MIELIEPTGWEAELVGVSSLFHPGCNHYNYDTRRLRDKLYYHHTISPKKEDPGFHFDGENFRHLFPIYTGYAI